MKNFILSLLIFNSFASYSQKGKTSFELEEIINKYYKTWQARNIKENIKYCTNSFIWIDSGDMMTLESIKLLLRKNNPFTERNDTIRTRLFRIKGNTGFLYYFHQRTTKEDSIVRNVYWIESAVFQKLKGEWKIELIHSTEINHW